MILLASRSASVSGLPSAFGSCKEVKEVPPEEVKKLEDRKPGVHV